MSKLDPNKLMSKAIINETNLPNSILNRQQANRFLDLVTDYSVLLKQVRHIKVDHPKGEVNKLDLGSIVTEGASSTSSASTRTPSESVVNYDMIKYRSAFDLATDFMEDNIEGKNVRDTLLDMFTKRIALDTEMAAIEGDDSLTTGDAQSDENNLLGVNDGYLAIIAAGLSASQKLNAAGTASSNKMFYDMMRKIPNRYRHLKSMYRWVAPSSIYDKWSYDINQKSTVGGDAAREGRLVYRPYGIDLIDVPLMPEDLTYGTNISNATKMLLTPPQNLLFFMQRDVTIEWDRQPRTDKWEVSDNLEQRLPRKVTCEKFKQGKMLEQLARSEVLDSFSKNLQNRANQQGRFNTPSETETPALAA